MTLNLNIPESVGAKYQEDINAFNAASDLIIPIWDGLSGPQKAAAQTTLSNWGSATDAERVVALAMLLALHQKALNAALDLLGLLD